MKTLKNFVIFVFLFIFVSACNQQETKSVAPNTKFVKNSLKNGSNLSTPFLEELDLQGQNIVDYMQKIQQEMEAKGDIFDVFGGYTQTYLPTHKTITTLVTKETTYKATFYFFLDEQKNQ
jgi:predicted PurR-regulated permease PerM